MKRKLVKDTKNFLKKKKSDNMAMNVSNISQEIKKINWVSIQKNIK